MKLVSFMWDRNGLSCVTDLDTLEFLRWAQENYSHNIAITYAQDISEADAKRWIAEGKSSVTRQSLRLAKARGAEL